MLKAGLPADRHLQSDWIMRPQNPLMEEYLDSIIGKQLKNFDGELS